jgi:tetratricopeptide (TPR) repeat protein
MTKKKISSRKFDIDILTREIEQALEPGEFIPYKQAWGFVQDLEDIGRKIDKLVKNGEAAKAVSLYEILLAGCYDKADEIDDSSGDLGMFFEEVFASWIKARQKAKCDPEETVHQILQWMENDDYGYCSDIEKKMVEALDRQGLKIFENSIKLRFEEALREENPRMPLRIYDFSYAVRNNAEILKCVYAEKKDIASYINLSEKIGVTPKDCENIAELHKAKKQFKEALLWIDKGLALEKESNWPNFSAWGLDAKKRELQAKLGQKEEAFNSAWSEFMKRPSGYTYEEFMKYIFEKDIEHWHKKAIEIARDTSLSAIIDLAVQTGEWDVLAQCIISAKDEELESLSHYQTEPAARGLKQKHFPAAAKVYRALAMRILKAGKSKYYSIAIKHFKELRILYKKIGCEKEWSSLVESIRKGHSRKYSFINKFEKMLSGEYPKSFVEKARKRWERQIS